MYFKKLHCGLRKINHQVQSSYIKPFTARALKIAQLNKMKSYLESSSTRIQVKRIRPKTCLHMVCAVIKNISISMSKHKTLVPRMKGFSGLILCVLQISVSLNLHKAFFLLFWLGERVNFSSIQGLFFLINFINSVFITLEFLIILLQLFQNRNRNSFFSCFFFFLTFFSYVFDHKINKIKTLYKEGFLQIFQIICLIGRTLTEPYRDYIH